MQFSRRKFLELIAATGATSAASSLVSATSRHREEPTLAEGRQKGFTDKGWAPRTKVRQPNILIAVLDDVGFADLSCFGSEYVMPFSDSMAKTAHDLTTSTSPRFAHPQEPAYLRVEMLILSAWAILLNGRKKASQATTAGSAKMRQLWQKYCHYKATTLAPAENGI